MFSLFPKPKERTLEDIIKEIAIAYRLRPEIVASVIMQESAGRANAIREERRFFHRYLETKTRSNIGGFVPPKIPTFDTEQRLRSFSFGLMQVMGQTAREFGYRKLDLVDLLIPEVNIEFGCKVLSSYIEAKGSLEAGLLRYNGGGDPQYPDKILKILNEKQYIGIYKIAC